MRSVLLVGSLVITGLLVLQPSGAQDSTINVTTLDDVVASDGECSLREALENVADQAATHADCPQGDTTNEIVIPAGTIFLDGAALEVAGEVAIRGQSAQDTTIDAGGASGIFLIGPDAIEVSLQDMTLTGGSQGTGGAVFVDSAVATFEGIRITGSAGFTGGGLMVRGPSTVTVLDSAFSGNIAAGGGAIFTDSDAGGSPTVSISNTSFSQNGATTGGAIAHSTGHLEVADSTFLDNDAQTRGGAIAMFDEAPTASISGSTFTGNNASQGGAIAVYETFANPQLVIEDSTFTMNAADAANASDSRGGAIYFHFGFLTIARSLLGENESGVLGGFAGRGGAIAIEGQPGRISSVAITDSVVQDNLAGTGGGLSITGQNADVSVAITGSTFARNLAEFAGAISAVLGTFQVLNSTFDHDVSLSGVINISGAGTAFVGTHVTVVAGAPELLMAGSGIISAGNAAAVILRNSVVVHGGLPSAALLACLATGGASFNGVANADDDGTCPNAIGVTSGDLHALGEHGGETPTRPPVAGSPLIDAASQAFCPATDQRGVPRPVGPACDIGAVEALFELVLPGVARE